jgi:hypothetical protein
MYTVKILSSEEFDKLPFSRAKEALGAADPKTNIAYVRDTGYNDVTKHTIEHELDELMQKTSPHEIDGIRYKIPVLGPIFSGLGNAAGAIGSGIGNVAGAVGSGIGKVAGGIGKAAGALGRGAKGLVSGGGADGVGSFGRLGDIGGGIKNVFAGGGADNAGRFGRIGDFFGHGASAAPSIRGSADAATGIGGLTDFPSRTLGGTVQPSTILGGASKSSSPILDFFKNAGGNLLQGTKNSILPGGPPGTGSGTQDGGFLDGIFQRAGEQAIPTIAGLIGNAFAPDPGDLDISGVTGDARSRLTGDAISPLFEAGQRELLEDLGSDILTPPEESFAAADTIIAEDLEDQIEALRNEFKRANPNANVDNNSAFLNKKAELQERARERRAQVRDEKSFEFTREQLDRDLTEIQTALEIDAAQTEQYIKLAQLDAEALALNHGISVAEANEFKALFGRFGQLLGGAGQQQQGNTFNFNVA